jgi:hypothetical protein
MSNKKTHDYLKGKFIFSFDNSIVLKNILLVHQKHKAISKKCYSKESYFLQFQSYFFQQLLQVSLGVARIKLLCKQLKKQCHLFQISYNTSFPIMNYFQIINILGSLIKKTSNHLVNSNPIIDIQINNIGYIQYIKRKNKNPIRLFNIKCSKSIGNPGYVRKSIEVPIKVIKPTISPITNKTLKINLFLSDISIQSLIFNKISLNKNFIVFDVYLTFFGGFF